MLILEQARYTDTDNTDTELCVGTCLISFILKKCIVFVKQ
jgi:hypothetical protein